MNNEYINIIIILLQKVMFICMIAKIFSLTYYEAYNYM